MAQAKLGHRSYTVLFCVAVFFLTSIGLAVLYYRMFASSFWFIFVYLSAWALLFAFAVDFFGGKGDGKLSGKKILVLTFGVMLVSTLFTHLVWTITAPKWSFSVSTDKATYTPGEPVTITASLMNMGLISHSFKSASSNPVVVSVEYQYAPNPTYLHQVYYSSLSRDITAFVVEPGETLERSFLWNQTDIYNPEEQIGQGTYWIYSYIPKETAEIFYFDNLFSAWTSMNITST